MNTGKIKWFDTTRGFGFIEMDNGQEIFVHHSGLEVPAHSLQEGQSVTFEIKEGPKGKVAFNVN